VSSLHNAAKQRAPNSDACGNGLEKQQRRFVKISARLG
jgi:hypothetical protein